MPDRNFEAELISLLKDATAAAYARGERDALERIMDAAKASVHKDDDVSLKRSQPRIRLTRKRAPRGIVRVMIHRILKDAYPNGLTPADIGQHAENSDERMVALASIRSHLNQNKGTLYREHGGRWFLIGGDAEKETAGPASTEPAEMENLLE